MLKVTLQQGSDSWLNWRREGLTATEAGVILNQNPNKSPWRLWMEKKGKATPQDLSSVPAVRFGRENEDTARKIFEGTHSTTAPAVCAEWDADRRFRASFDGLTPEGIPVEFKCPQGNTLADVRENGEFSEAYLLYFFQVQHQLLVSEAPYGWLCFLDGMKLIEFKILRSEETIRQIISAGKVFLDSLQGNEPPAADQSKDPLILSGESAKTWLELAETWLACEQHIKEVERYKKLQGEVADKMKEILGDFKFCEGFGVRLSASDTQGAIDWKKFAESVNAAPSEYEKFRKAGSKKYRVTPTGRLGPEGFDTAELEILEKSQDDIASADWMF